MFFGIGFVYVLCGYGIILCVDLFGVGGNLQDYLDICMVVYIYFGVSYDCSNELCIVIDYFLCGYCGVGISNLVEVGGFVCLVLVLDVCVDVQFYFVLVMFDNYGCYCLFGDGYMLYVCLLYLCSCGRLYLCDVDVWLLL